MPVLTLLECSSIQSYIFASNRLKEAIGGSYLVRWTLEELLPTTLTEFIGTENVVTAWRNATGLTTLTPTGKLSEILYIGGGNAAVLFENQLQARDYVKYFSSRLLGHAPGLRLLAVHSEIKEGLSRTLKTALGKIAELKEQGLLFKWETDLVANELDLPAILPFQPGSLPITKNCATTGQAAALRLPSPESGRDDSEFVSAGAAARRAAAEPANTQAQNILDQVGLSGFAFTDQLDQLGGREGESHLAVVHIDGNAIGERLKAILRKYEHKPDDQVAQALRQFSKTIEEAANQAQNRLILTLGQALQKPLTQDLYLHPVKGESQKRHFPLRLLVSGGDDLTFVCDGRIGLALTAHYLRYFNSWPDPQSEKFTACAGVVIAHSHFPLARAYYLSEELCRRAKMQARDDQNKSSWLDFQILFSGLTDRLSELRTGSRAGLFWRPYRVTGESEVATRQDWEYFERQVRNLQTNWPRSQVKDLRDALTAGPSATRRFLAQARLRQRSLSEVPGAGSANKDGWHNDQTPFFDPVEALDFYLTV